MSEPTLRMTGSRVIEQDGGFVAVAELSDGTLSTPMGATVRDSAEDAEADRPLIEYRDGPRVRSA